MSPLMPRGFGCAHASRGDGLAAKHAVVNMAVRWWQVVQCAWSRVVQIQFRCTGMLVLLLVRAGRRSHRQTRHRLSIIHSHSHSTDSMPKVRAAVPSAVCHPIPLPTTPHRPDPSKIPVDILDVIEHVSMHQRRVLCLVVDPAESRKQKTHLSAAFGLRLAVTSRPLRAPARPRLSLRHRSHALERSP
jgi:hypothetical protein